MTKKMIVVVKHSVHWPCGHFKYSCTYVNLFLFDMLGEKFRTMLVIRPPPPPPYKVEGGGSG